MSESPLLDEIKALAQGDLLFSDVSGYAWIELPPDIPTSVRCVVPPVRIGGHGRDGIEQAEARVDRARLISDKFGELDVYLAVAPEIETVYYRYR